MTDWEIRLKKVNNGFILTYHEETETGTHLNEVVFGNKENELQVMVDVLHFIQEHFGYNGSKHDKHRIFIKLKKQN